MPYICVKFPYADQYLLDYIKDNISFFDHRQDGLMIDYANYGIGPHVDQAYLLAGMLLYCPKDMDHLDYGTAFYNSDDKRLFAYDTGAIPNYYTRDEFVLSKIAPYAPNTLVVILQNPQVSEYSNK